MLLWIAHTCVRVALTELTGLKNRTKKSQEVGKGKRWDVGVGEKRRDGDEYDQNTLCGSIKS